MSEIIIFGHKNPDTDAIGSAIAYSYLQNKLGLQTKAVALGEAGDETKYALDHFGLQHPEIVERLENPGDPVMLVDHNEFQQSIDGIEDAEILSVVDHHRIANFETSNPLNFRAEPLGSTCSIVYKLFKENQIDISQDIGGIMLSAIISDSLLFKSPTCTPTDAEIAKDLAEIAQVDLNTYGLDMLRAGTNVDKFTEEEILEGDAKTFEMGESTVRIGQVNVVDIQDVLKRKETLIHEMEKLSTANNYGLYLLVITDILESNSQGLVVGSQLEAVEEAFATGIENHEIALEGVVSRKKQVVPPLTEALS
ncbi:MAG: manganese-dependent inorganic pyrophosphatase [Atopococcus tabaci]|uniref:Probable manganese-dependent inorganic pyrophosphatase n=1 Tax=Atopococcus tabaci TaxID=269774 RepID=A0AA43UDD7_9LACT|nr:manganese-dependent inorganic pyrophosphatase [Atopococcus tabaci]